ncbi:MurR/RpiR family transcriptional regulator [Streptomyces sp. NPDC020917]|uniref:MurR/RpiR family transcriptional regulator n=1 Tax=Streptomyces sp. NPDC020917 TaxID=3365102 RepID=UPI003788ED23
MDHLLAKLERESATMSGALRRVAGAVLADPAAAADEGITELAQRSDTSPATVNRFCRALSINGYAAFRVALAADLGRLGETVWAHTVGLEIDGGDSTAGIARAVVAADIRSLQRTADLLDPPVVDRAVDLLGRARAIHAFGLSGSSHAAAELRARLVMIGLPVTAGTDTLDALAAAARLRPGDVQVSFSHSGATAEVVEVQDVARSFGASTIAVTSEPSSPLALAADLVLATRVAESADPRTQSFASRYSQLFLLDVLFVCLANRTAEQSTELYDSARAAVAAHQRRVAIAPRSPS